MDRRLAAAGIAVLATGVFFLIVPALAVPAGTATLSAGEYMDVQVPGALSLVPVPVYLQLLWNQPTCPGHVFCQVPPTFVVSVLDCGSSPCGAAHGGTWLGAATGGSASFGAALDHSYRVVVTLSGNPNSTVCANCSTSIAASVVAPVAGGWAGVALLVGGSLVALYGVRLVRTGRAPPPPPY